MNQFKFLWPLLGLPIVLLSVFAISGCSMATGTSSYLPTADQVSRSDRTWDEIEVYQQGYMPQRGIVCIANVAAHGNGYATEDTLKDTLRKEAAKVGADVVILTKYEVSKDETVGSYGYGTFMSNQINRPHLYGLAGVYSKVSLGIVVEKDGIIKYVTSGSSAEQAGLKEGMQILSINGVYFSSNIVLQQEVGCKNAGDTITIEYLDQSKEKKRAMITLHSAEPVRNAVNYKNKPIEQPYVEQKTVIESPVAKTITPKNQVETATCISSEVQKCSLCGRDIPKFEPHYKPNGTIICKDCFAKANRHNP